MTPRAGPDHPARRRPFAARRRYETTLGLAAGEDDLAVLELGDVVQAFGPGLGLEVVSDGDPATAADPDGTPVALVPPNRKRRPPPRRIGEFIAAAGPILGRTIKDPADAAPRRTLSGRPDH